jgi:glycoprotein-N-acetylgalactosamine 3-beta-galactosyltransferase
MQNLNVTAGDSRDEQGRGRFFAVLPEQMLVPDLVPKGFWFFGYSYYPVETVRLIFR